MPSKSLPTNGLTVELAEALRNLLDHLTRNNLHEDDYKALDRADAALAAYDEAREST